MDVKKIYIIVDVPVLCYLLSFEPRKKTLLLSIESWLFNRDPSDGLWNNPHLIVYSTIPDLYPKQLGFVWLFIYLC